MKITFLGTGTSQGVPLIACNCEVCTSADARDKRLRSSLLVQSGNLNIVIDSGPDFRQQMLQCGIRHLDALVFTHAHKDHIAGMDDIRGFNFSMRKPIQVYCTQQVENQMRREFAYIFDEHKYPGIPDIVLNRIDASPFSIGGLDITPIEVLHYKLPVLGFRFGKFTYITDANFIADEEKQKIKGSEYLVLNALRRESHISHFNLDEAIQLIDELAPRKAFLTHISHQLGLYADVSKELPAHIALAYDGLTLDV